MKNLIVLSCIILLIQLFQGCAELPAQKHIVEIESMPVNAAPTTTTTRSDRYYNCITGLNRDGIKQSLIKSLCDSSYGSID